MAKISKLKELKNEFSFLKDKVIGVLLFGSEAEDNAIIRSDVDICIVAPNQKSRDILKLIYQKIDVYKKKYDIYTFGELPLYMKDEVLKNHKVIVARDKPELYEYFYFYRKLINEQKHRQMVSKEEILER